MSRAARLGAFIVVTLANSGGRYLHHWGQAVSFQLDVSIEVAIRQRGGPGCGRRTCGWAEFTVGRCAASSCRTNREGRLRSSWISANRRTRSSSKTRWRRSKLKDCWATSIWRFRLDPPGRPMCGMAIRSRAIRRWRWQICCRRPSGILDSSQQAIENATQGDGESGLDQRQDQSRPGNSGSAGERQAALYQPRADDQRRA